ncbi:restriction endonuclease subunit S [Acinetobacter nosocomialis]|uniref:restriction endonuclease subunit S n=1 Tax=Acinetobacter nosocomialis TaxID=106654 RepID=UPI00374FB845
MVNDTANFIAGFGIIPNDWSCKTANEICTKISKGTTPSKSEISNEGNIPFLRVNNLTLYGRLALDSDFIFVSKESHENFLSRSMAFPNDILMNIVGPPLGKTALLDDSYPEYNMNQAIVFYRLQKNLVDSKYFLEFLNSFKAQQWLQSRSKKTSGQQNLTIEICKDLPIILPPLVEQKKIAQILSTWDQAILATEKLLENSQQQKKALMEQLLTGKKRLLDENGVRFSGVWKHIKLRSLIKEIKRDKEENPNNIELLTVKLHNKGAVASGKFPNSTEGGRPYYKRFAGELIIGRQNLHNGGVAIVPSECNGLIASNAISSFEALNDCDINFILSIMSTSHFRYLIDNLTGGTGQKEVSVRELLNVFVLIPSVEEQQKIAKVLTIADQEIETLQKKLDCLKQEKKALMQQLLTGKKRVKVAA